MKILEPGVIFTISIGQSHFGKLLCFAAFEGWIVTTDLALAIPIDILQNKFLTASPKNDFVHQRNAPAKILYWYKYIKWQEM